MCPPFEETRGYSFRKAGGRGHVKITITNEVRMRLSPDREKYEEMILDDRGWASSIICYGGRGAAKEEANGKKAKTEKRRRPTNFGTATMGPKVRDDQ